MTARPRQESAAAPLRLFAVVHADAPDQPGGWHSAGRRLTDGSSIEAVHAFTAEEHAWEWLLTPFPGDPGHETAMRLAWRIIEFVATPTAPPCGTAWGDGPFDYVELAPGVRAALRVTTDGDVVLLIAGGELTITPGAVQLGLGLLEASKRAAQIRAQREDRQRRNRGMDARAPRRRTRR